MQTPTPSSHEGPLRISKAFRRLTGALAIMSSLLLADLAGFLLTLLIGILIGSPIWWLLRIIAHLFHASIVFDIGLILILLCYAIGAFGNASSEKTARMRGDVSVSLCSSLGLRCSFWPSSSPIGWHFLPPSSRPLPQKRFPGAFSFASSGIVLAATLYLLAHLIVLRRLQREPEQELRSFSRAHPDGQPWLLIEHAYAVYRRSLTRFNPPPIIHLKTPRPSTTTSDKRIPMSFPIRSEKCIGKQGILIINQAYIGPKPEQTEILLPFLARLLYDNNSSDHLVKNLFQLAHEGETQWFCAWLLAGLFLLPGNMKSAGKPWNETMCLIEIDLPTTAGKGSACGEGCSSNSTLSPRTTYQTMLSQHLSSVSTT